LVCVAGAEVGGDTIDSLLTACGWTVQKKNKINLHASISVAVTEYITDAGIADYILFVDQKPVGVIEAKKAEEGRRLTLVEEQSSEYAHSKLKYLNNDPLPFVYESTGEVTRFTDYRDPKPRSRLMFAFHRPETFREWLKEENSLVIAFSNIFERWVISLMKSHRRSVSQPRAAGANSPMKK